MMKKADKKAWVAALRSGDYEQGRTRLCRDNKYCCLGVAYDVLYDGDWVQVSKHIWRPERAEIWDHRSVDFLSHSVELELGLTLGKQIKLSGFNDHQGWTFDEIAEWIEASSL